MFIKETKTVLYVTHIILHYFLIFMYPDQIGVKK